MENRGESGDEVSMMRSTPKRGREKNEKEHKGAGGQNCPHAQNMGFLIAGISKVVGPSSSLTKSHLGKQNKDNGTQKGGCLSVCLCGS